MQGKNARKVRKDVNLKLVIGIVSAVLILSICVGLLVCYTITDKIVSENVYVNSIYVGGMSAEEATAKITSTVTKDYFNKIVTINYGDKSYDLNLLDYLSVDASATVKAALEVNTDNEKEIIPFKLILNEDVKKEMVNFSIGVEDKGNFITFNEDYTVANIDVSGMNEILDVDKTLAAIVENAEYDIYNTLDAVMIKKTDEGFADALYTRVSRGAVDASIGINDDQSTYIIPEILGMEVDKNEFLSAYKSGNDVFSVSVKVSFPEMTTEKLDIEFYQDVLGTYTSTYDAGLKNRTANVTLAANLVNGTVIMPGQTFSYNKIVGPRTAARGFKAATVYTGEGTEEGLGGGICQVSSTIYCAQLRANLKTVSRTNHSYTVVYVPLGQDATVSYGVLDYVFENDTNFPVKIETTVGGGKLTVNILGTKEDKSLTYDVVSVTNSTIAKKDIEEEDPTLPTGETAVKQKGQNGAVVSTYKVYYKDGVEKKREFIGKSTYVAMNRIVKIGTGEAVENSEEITDYVEGDVISTIVPDGESGKADTPETDTPEIEFPEADVTVPETSDTGL